MTQPVTDFALGRLGIPMPAFFPGNMSRVTISGSNTQTVVLTTGLVRVAVTTDCYVARGVNPSASNTDMYMPAGSVEYFAVIPGEKLAFLQVSSGGFASITQAAVIDN
jgi:hypothetical protein